MAFEFKEFGKIPRLKREVCVTEKLDGTNACVVVTEEGEIGAQSRNRIITPEADNYGFAKWVQAHAEELKALGPGYHYGEWWGQGVGRGYGLQEKRFSLFNVQRWSRDSTNLPSCCHVVPQIVPWGDMTCVETALEILRTQGSLAAAGWHRPEGVIVYHSAGRQYYKVTLENDDTPKAKVEA